MARSNAPLAGSVPHSCILPTIWTELGPSRDLSDVVSMARGAGAETTDRASMLASAIHGDSDRSERRGDNQTDLRSDCLHGCAKTVR